MVRGPYGDRGASYEEARRLRKLGYGYRKIGARLSPVASPSTVRRWVIDIDADAETAHRMASDEQRRPFADLKTNQHRRRALIRVRGHRCERCQLETWQGVPIPLELEHVGGNRSDNGPESLKLLCPNCHALTPNWKGRAIKLKRLAA